MLRNALDGLTVIDFTQIGAGPTCTMLLADMGARVLKVESPAGELGRGLGPAWIGEDSALLRPIDLSKLKEWLWPDGQRRQKRSEVRDQRSD